MDEPKLKKQRTTCPESNKIRSLLLPILSDEELRTCELFSAYCADITDQKQINTIIQQLPLDPAIAHLKRLKRTNQSDNKVSLLLCPQSEQNSLPPAIESLATRFNLHHTTTQVPKYPPLTIAQMTEWSTHWPVSTKSLAPTTPSPDIFTEEQILNIKRFMGMAQQQADIAAQKGHRRIGSVMVSVEKNEWQVVAQGHDSSKSHVLDHSTMNCINALSATQLEAKDPTVYLATGYYFFTTREPCVMCAMALLHSRIGIVFYNEKNLEGGGLGSKFKVHCQKSLNHNFSVYQSHFPANTATPLEHYS